MLADIDPATFNLSAAAVEEVVRSHTGSKIKAVLPVHLYGQCADWDAFSALKQSYDLLLIEDAAQAFGADWNGIPAGALGDVAAFSFYPTKNLSAMGDAGLVTTLSAEFDDHARVLRAHGMRRRYYHDEVGWNSRLDSLQAAILEVKLRYLPQWNQQRRELAAPLRSSSSATPALPRSTTAEGVVLPFTDPRADHVFHQYVIRAPRRDELREYLADRQIGSEIYYPLPLHLQTSLAGLGYKQGDFPISEAAAARGAGAADVSGAARRRAGDGGRGDRELLRLSPPARATSSFSPLPPSSSSRPAGCRMSLSAGRRRPAG